MSEVPSIASEAQKLNPSSIIELYELDTRNHVGGEIFRFHAGVNGLQSYITWKGNQYVPFPIQAEGFEWKGSGTLPRPRVTIANVTGLLGAAVREMDDLIGSRLTRLRTFSKYLDAVNFPGGNPLADPTAEFARDVFFINRKVTENKFLIEFELASMLDVHGVKLPKRMIISNVCSWKYRGPECGYTGGPIADQKDVATTDPAQDQCGKRVESCKLRFPLADQAQMPTFGSGDAGGQGLPFGGFPGVAIVRV